MRFQDLSLSKKLFAAFVAVVVASVCADFMLFKALDVIRDRTEKNAHSFELTMRADAMLLSVIEQQNAIRALLASDDRSFVTAYEMAKQQLAENAGIFEAGTASLEQKQRSEEVRKVVEHWQSALAERQIALMANARTQDEARSLVGSIPLDEARNKLAEIQSVQKEMFGERMKATDDAGNSARLTLIIGGTGATLISVVMGLFLSRSIAVPIAGMTAAMRRLADGDGSVDVPSIDRRDEIGAMAKAVQVFKDAGIEQRRQEAEARVAREAQASSRDRQAAIDNAKAEDLKIFVHAVEAGFDRLSAGDLTVQMNQAVAVEFEPIRAKFNDSVSQLESTIGSVVGAVGSMRVGLNQITVAAGDLSQRTEQQAASLEETVAALSEVARGVNGTAQSADDARAAATLAQREAEKGGVVVAQAVAAMAGIETSSNKIGNIISVIDEIAFQTNLLALNAGVEAARAGEAGRGFAVVAQEVRGLAQRSAEAAKEIKELISASSAQVASGVELVSASGRSLEQIVAQVGGVATVVAEMAHSAREQSVSLREVSTAADQMDKVTQQNAAMVEETTAAAQSLSSETEELAALTERFQVRASNGGGGGHAVSQASIRRPSSAKPATARPVRQMKHTGFNGTVAKSAPFQDSWEEF